MIENFAENDTGLLFIANGIGKVLIWDGFTSQVEEAGLDAPTAALTVAGTGNGAIVGTFTAYLRFVDRHGWYSNLSPISNEYTAEGATGTITAASNTTPIVITSAAHGLNTGATVKITGVGGNTSANSTFQIVVLSSSTFSLDDSTGTATYTGGGTWTSGVASLSYTSVEAATDPRIRRRQILRNTDGQADVYYVDVDTEDLSTTTFSSTRSDTDLATQEAQSILDEDGGILANGNTPPPDHKPYMAYHLGHMFYAGQRDYKRGGVQVATGSLTVTGIGTDWVANLEDRYLYVVGADQEYQIDSVDISAQTLTLTEAYQGDTDLFAVYAIRPAPAERRTVYYSMSGLPASVPATNGVTIPETGDEITGLMVRGSWLYVLEKRRTWKITFADSLPEDLGLFPSGDRGCVNNRCWVRVDDMAYMLDEQGVHVFGGAAEPDQVSQQIQEIFRPEGTGKWRIDWESSELFHAVHYRPQETVRWFVCMSGSLWPRHALCYQYRLKRWWVEEYPLDVSGSCAGHIKDVPAAFVGVQGRTVLKMNAGALDLADPRQGQVRGTATSSGLLSLTDSSTTFTSSLVNAPLSIVDGRGRGQTRKIVSVSSGTLTLSMPWNILPDTTSVYQAGGVSWRFLTSWFRYGMAEEDAPRRFELVFDPLKKASLARMNVFHDFEDEADVQAYSMTSAAGGGVKSTAGESDFRIDLTKRSGVAQKVYPGHREHFSDGPRFVQLELSGATNEEIVSIYQITAEGVGNPTARE
jgi:hypothetical protein